MDLQTKLTDSQLALACYESGLDASKENMAMAAFFNDADFREKVTRFYFNRAMSQVKEAV